MALARDGSTLLLVATNPNRAVWRRQNNNWQIAHTLDTRLVPDVRNAHLSSDGSLALVQDNRDLYLWRPEGADAASIALRGGPQDLARRLLAIALSDDGHTAAALYSIANAVDSNVRVVLWVFAL